MFNSLGSLLSFWYAFLFPFTDHKKDVLRQFLKYLQQDLHSIFFSKIELIKCGFLCEARATEIWDESWNWWIEFLKLYLNSSLTLEGRDLRRFEQNDQEITNISTGSRICQMSMTSNEILPIFLLKSNNPFN